MPDKPPTEGCYQPNCSVVRILTRWQLERRRRNRQLFASLLGAPFQLLLQPQPLGLCAPIGGAPNNKGPLQPFRPKTVNATETVARRLPYAVDQQNRKQPAR